MFERYFKKDKEKFVRVRMKFDRTKLGRYKYKVFVEIW
jgi:hypothetical protein